MKTMKFFLMSFLLLLFVVGLNAQMIHKTQTIQRTSTFQSLNFPVRCNNVIIDMLKGSATIHFLTHYDNDEKLDWYKQEMKDIYMVSLLTNERFEVSSVQKQDGIGLYEDIVIVTRHFNCVGEWGSHYIVSETIQLDFTQMLPNGQPTQTILDQDCKCW